MSRTSDAEIAVHLAPAELRRAAVELALSTSEGPSHPSFIDRAWAEAESDPSTWQGLLVAQCGPRLVGAAWLRFLAGNVAAMNEPRPTADAPPGTLRALACEALAVMRRRQATLCQVLVEDAESTSATAVAAAGFRHGSDLLYLVSCASRSAPLADLPDAGLRFIEYDHRSHQRLAGIVERTYVGTRDCPQLNGVRNIEDVLAGYRATGIFSPSRWLIVARDGVDVGCLLLADHPDDDQWELVYLGVVPQMRGQGLGLAITRHAQTLARRAGRARLVLAVDAANEPALAIYARAGFDAWFRRSIFLATGQKTLYEAP